MQPPKKITPPKPARPLRFGMRVQVVASGHFYEGLYGTLIGAACHEPFYQLCLDVLPEQECWIQGDCLNPLSKGDVGYDAPELPPELLVELDQD